LVTSWVLGHWLPSSTMVKQSTHNLDIKGLNPANATGK
jgi:hypothetical protein